MASELVSKDSARFSAAGKLIDIETLSEQISDELARQLASRELSQRSLEAFQAQFHDCPTCGRTWPIETDPEPVLLQGTRGEIEYTEPRCHCQKCRDVLLPPSAFLLPHRSAASVASPAGQREQKVLTIRRR